MLWKKWSDFRLTMPMEAGLSRYKPQRQGHSKVTDHNTRRRSFVLNPLTVTGKTAVTVYPAILRNKSLINREIGPHSITSLLSYYPQ
jgi:hypothetical protein